MELLNASNLVGDLLGTVPAMIDLAKANGGLRVYQTLDEGKWVYPMLPEEYNIVLAEDAEIAYGNVLAFNLSEAFSFSHEDNLYMGQCFHHQVGLMTPEHPVRPELVIPETKHQIYDWILAPFGRSAGEMERWQNSKWQELIDRLIARGDSVCVFGNSKYDFKDQFYNCTLMFDRPMPEVLDILRKSKKGCISIMTGISHACYAAGAKNYVLCNQYGAWGRNPEGKFLETYIPDITVDELINFIDAN